MVVKPITLRLPFMRFQWYRRFMARYWRWKSGWPGCCHKKEQCGNCPMRAYEIRFVSAPPKPLEGYWEDSNGVRYTKYPLTTDKKPDTVQNDV